jgi:hypothetical protein
MDIFVVRTELPRQEGALPSLPQKTLSSLVLQSLSEPNSMVRFDMFASEKAARVAGDEVYQVVFEVRGVWKQVPTHAVYAVWQITELGRVPAFIDSRRELFELRQRVLPTFATDRLLERLDHTGRYMVLGLYGDEEGATRFCREHPVIRQFAQAHPASNYTATDITGICSFRIVDFVSQLETYETLEDS